MDFLRIMNYLREYRNTVAGTIMFFISIHSIYSAFCPLVYAIVVSLIGWVLCCLVMQTTRKIKFRRYFTWVCLLCINTLYSDYLMEHFSIKTRSAMLNEMVTWIIVGVGCLFGLIALFYMITNDIKSDIEHNRAAKKATDERIRNNPTGCPKCGCNYQILIGYYSDGEPYKYKQCPNCGYRGGNVY